MRSSDVLQIHESTHAFPFEVCNLLLGKGGGGQVFLGRIGNSNTYVAIKKRYGRYSVNAAKANCKVAKNSGPSQPLQRARNRLSPNMLVSSLGSHFICRGESDLQSLEVGGSVPVSQRRELDLGEESVSQIAALSNQHENCTGEISSDGAVKQTAVSSVMDEVAVLNYLGPHPQIVRFLGSYTTSKNTSFFTMELMDSDVGRELREGNAALHEESVCAAIAYSVLLALEQMHSHAVAHRDVKPGNILLKRLTESEEWACIWLSNDDLGASLLTKSSSGSARHPTLCTRNAASYVKAALGDFSAAHSTRCTDDAAFADTRGTLHYKSPEQLMGKRHLLSENVAAVDLWGLGCTLYEMATGARPFPGSSELQVLMSMLDAMGSDIQSFPVSTRHATLFDEIPASPAFVNFLQRLLCLDPARRCTATEALRHPFVAPIRDSAEHQIPTDCRQRVIGIPLALKYASFTHIPELRFTRISQTPLKAMDSTPTGLSAPQQAVYSRRVVPPPASDAGAATLSVAAEREVIAPPRSEYRDTHPWGDGPATTAWGQEVDCEDHEEKETPSKKPPPPHCSDTTGTSFLSESSYLHWSEIRPIVRPSAPPQVYSLPKPLQHKDDKARSSSGSRAVAFFGNATVGSTPSPTISGNNPQQQLQSLSGSKHRTTAIETQNTVSRVLNISDSSVKGVRAERSASHVDFDLSPVPATQLFSTEADTSAFLVPHPAATFLPRRAHPTLQLPNGSTFTASNLRANLSFEHENLMVGWYGSNGAPTSAALGVASSTSAILAGHCSTPLQHRGRRSTAFSGRALCFSEEMDPFARRSWGSSAGQQSCLNSLLTSPAPVGRAVAEECSPQPSPICPVEVATRSPSGLPVVADRSGLSLDDSGVGLGWIGVPPAVAAVQASICGDASEAAAAATVPALVCDVSRGAEASAAVAPMFCSAHLQPSWNAGHPMASGSAQSSNSPWAHHLKSPPDGCPRSPACSTVASATAVASIAVADQPEAPCSSQLRRPTTSLPLTGARDVSSSRTLPLPIPLSVATVRQPVSPSLCTPTLRSRTPTNRALHETPLTQRFSCPTSTLRTGRTGHKNGHLWDSSKPLGPPTSCVNSGDTPIASSFLCHRDINVPATHLTHRGSMSVGLPGSGSGAAPALLGTAATSPDLLAVFTYSSQYHCTPSSRYPAPESALPTRGDGSHHPVAAIEASSMPTATVVRALEKESSTGGSHTPLPGHGSASPPSRRCDVPLLQLNPASLGRNLQSVKGHESECIETSQSKQRGSMKRAREEAMNSEDVAAVRQSARVV
ncbi:putative Protein kinase domain/Protein tyrosine kinase [Leishmania shawi]|uniref:Protein kinase domain-containing protein n=1 Tax=Leishmania shawi TaxID=5680 RepID=A0AAW3BS82_9TRYP